MDEIAMNEEMIDRVKRIAPSLVKGKLQGDLKKIILYGSCARGDYNEDSDIDIALITESKGKKYNYNLILAELSTRIAMETYAVVNFVCLDAADYNEKKSWYPYYKNIENEGVVLFE